MITYQTESFKAFMPEFKEVIPAHYEELSVTKEFELDPDWDRYIALEDAGILKVITCRNDSELIGYIIFFIQPHIHYKQCFTAFEDIYYLKKEYRKGRTGIKMFKFAEEYLKSIGVQRVLYGTKVHLDNSRLFEYLGYKFFEKLYGKLI